MPESTVILDAVAIQRALTRIGHEIAERNENSKAVVLIGIPIGGDDLANRLSAILCGIWQHPVPVGVLDVGMHRDDSVIVPSGTAPVPGPWATTRPAISWPKMRGSLPPSRLSAQGSQR